MNHNFVASQTSADICAKCKFPYKAHTDEAECESCGNVGPVDVRYGNMLLCATCWSKELELKNQPIEPTGNVTNEQAFNIQSQMLQESRSIDTSLEMRSDIFNAETTAIIDIKKTIGEDNSITNKPYKLAEMLMERLTHFRKIGFELSEQVVANGNQQRAIQQYLNTMSNELRQEEREKLKLQDINYNPGKIRAIKPKTISTKEPKKKLDKSLLKKYAIELGISEFTLHTVAIGKGGDVEAAYQMIKTSLAAAKAAQ